MESVSGAEESVSDFAIEAGGVVVALALAGGLAYALTRSWRGARS